MFGGPAEFWSTETDESAHGDTRKSLWNTNGQNTDHDVVMRVRVDV